MTAFGAGQADWTLVLLTGIGLLVAGLVKGATGLGYSTCALPFLVSAVGLKSAIVVVPIPALAANLGLLFGAGHIAEMLRRFWIFYAATVPGIIYGTKLLAWIDQRLATQLLGLVTVAFTLYGAFRPNLTLPLRWERPLQLPAGLLNGVLTGLTGSQVIPLLPYMLSLKLDADRFVQAVNIAVVTASAILGLALLVNGLATWHLAMLSALGIFRRRPGQSLALSTAGPGVPSRRACCDLFDSPPCQAGSCFQNATPGPEGFDAGLDIGGRIALDTISDDCGSASFSNPRPLTAWPSPPALTSTFSCAARP